MFNPLLFFKGTLALTQLKQQNKAQFLCLFPRLLSWLLEVALCLEIIL